MLVRGEPGGRTTSFSNDPEDAYSLVTFRPPG
jgi:hypothetical protein